MTPAEKRHEEDLFNEWLNEIAPNNRDIGRESAWLGWKAGRAALRARPSSFCMALDEAAEEKVFG